MGTYRRMKRYAIELEYDGSKFHGWQAQPSDITIQVEIEKALKIFTGENVRITASGRTDSGVSALGQVAHFDLGNNNFQLQRLVRGLNGILKKDIVIKNAYIVPDDFNARFSAKSREYLYLIYNDSTPSPFYANRALWVAKPLDLDYLNRSVGEIAGEMDFASFCKKISQDNGTIRKIESVTFSKEGKLILFNIVGNAFLHNMIRIIIGTLLEMHDEQSPSGYLTSIIEKRNRDFAGKTASPYGLYLKQITYDPPLSSFDSAF